MLRQVLAPLLFLTAVGHATTLPVPETHSTIQSGIDAAAPGDTVLVAPGTYSGDGNRDLDFGGKDLTLRSSGGREVTWIDCEGTDEDPHRGIYLHSGETVASRIEGFTITGGQFPWGDLKTSRGGGILLENASATLVECTIRECSAWTGGGICALGSYGDDPINLKMINCDIVDCGIGSFTSGGGLYTGAAAIEAVDCRIEGNHAAQNGGGLFLNTHSELSATRCSFSGNELIGRGDTQGAGIRTFRGSMDLDECTIQNNTAGIKSRGGGIFHEGQRDEPYQANLTNCVVTGNRANRGGGIEVRNDNTMNLRFSTVAGNSGSPGAGVASTAFAQVKAFDSIIWGNEGDGQIYTEYNGTLSARYCDIEGGREGDGNIDADPLFSDSARDDYHLTDASPCIDSAGGDGETVIDMDGDDRPQGDGYDMGADEYAVQPTCDLEVQLDDYPVSLMPGEALKFRASAHNDCDQALGLDKATLTITGPAGLERRLYSGRMIMIDSGGEVGATVQLTVPGHAPVGTYDIEVTIFREGAVIDSNSFSLELTSVSGLTMSVPGYRVEWVVSAPVGASGLAFGPSGTDFEDHLYIGAARNALGGEIVRVDRKRSLSTFANVSGLDHLTFPPVDGEFAMGLHWSWWGNDTFWRLNFDGSVVALASIDSNPGFTGGVAFDRWGDYGYQAFITGSTCSGQVFSLAPSGVVEDFADLGNVQLAGAEYGPGSGSEFGTDLYVSVHASAGPCRTSNGLYHVSPSGGTEAVSSSGLFDIPFDLAMSNTAAFGDMMYLSDVGRIIQISRDGTAMEFAAGAGLWTAVEFDRQKVLGGGLFALNEDGTVYRIVAVGD